MTSVKRPLSICQSSEEKTKKLRSTSDDRQIISSLEKLPNELFYEIFDYLDGCQLYEAFSNLNIRFQNLLDCSSLRLKIRLLSHPEDQVQRNTDIITSNRHRIVSLSLHRSYFCGIENFPQFTIDSSFWCLEYLSLDNIKSNDVLPLLVSLSSLPRLSALAIETIHELEDIGNVYQAVFQLPTLKYNRITLYPFILFDETFIPLPIASNEQWTRIEYLSIHHCCAIDELMVILTYTPRLCRLSCSQVNSSNGIIKQQTLNIKSNLTHIFIDKCLAPFVEMETFMTKVSPHLEVLDITCSKGAAYLDADRWERIISQYLLHLRIFKFKYEDDVDEDLEVTVHHGRINRFNSSFWIKRNWFFHLCIDIESLMGNMIIVYSILPYRENNEEDLPTNQHQSVELSRTNQLAVDSILDVNDDNELHFDNLGFILIISQITCLKINSREIFIGTLINLIEYLPKLHSLIISSLSMLNPRCLSANEARTLRVISQNNKITQVKLKRMNDLAQIQFLVSLCPRMEYFEVDCTNVVYPEEVIRFILMKDIKYIPNLSSLCLNIKPGKAILVDHLKKIIDFEQLHHNYTIQQIENKIHLQWN